MRTEFLVAIGLTAALAADISADAKAGNSTLSGSRASMTYQHQVARDNDFSFLRTSNQVAALVEEGRLVELEGNADYGLAKVSYPYARPVLKTFVERLGAQYRDACGERLMVTSLTRPVAEQPRNASPLSVHPAGMAVDLRIPTSLKCRTWLETTLLALENRGLLDVTRERTPPHYHVAVFPEQYSAYAAPLIAAEEAARAEELAALARITAASSSMTTPAQAGMGVGAVPLPPLLFALVTLGIGGALIFRVPRRNLARVPSRTVSRPSSRTTIR